MLSPLGTPGTYFETGSSRLSLPSCASCRITAAVIVLVFEAIRKWVSALGGIVVPNSVVPWVTVKSPWGVRRRTTAPGNQELLGGLVHHGLQRGLVDRLERRAGRGSRRCGRASPCRRGRRRRSRRRRAPCDQEGSASHEARDPEVPASAPPSRPLSSTGAEPMSEPVLAAAGHGVLSSFLPHRQDNSGFTSSVFRPPASMAMLVLSRTAFPLGDHTPSGRGEWSRGRPSGRIPPRLSSDRAA